MEVNKALSNWTDLQDENRKYVKGDLYVGRNVARTKSLQTENNRLKKPLLQPLTKDEIIEELEKRNVKVNKRDKKTELNKELANILLEEDKYE